jgi:uracil-DNA glycosylase
MERSDELLVSLARCPIVDACLRGSDLACSEIVLSQKVATLAEFQVPEPWSGDIGNAPILFLSSNPTIDNSADHSPEVYPTSGWADSAITDYFRNRFGSGPDAWTKDLRSRRVDGTYADKGRFWSAVDARATELLGRSPVAGVDYVLSEVVHCKSDGELGVETALQECAPRWLPGLLESAGAAVIVCLGSRARAAVSELLGVAQHRIVHKTHIAGKARVLVFLPHPNARSERTFKARLSPDELADVQSMCRK